MRPEASEEKRQQKGWWLEDRGRRTGEAERSLARDGVFRGGDMESGNSCLAG